MSFKSRIAGVGGYVPENVFTNYDIEKMMDTTNDWIVQRTGIEERRWVSEDQSTSDLALKATEEALNDAGLDKSDIEMIIFATLSPDHDFPGSGCFLQAKLDLPGIAVLDIRQQCSGFLYAMSIADQYIKTGTYKNILVVGAEVHSKGLDRTPNGRAVSVLFGDGAGAVVFQRTEVNNEKTDGHILVSNLHADGEYAKELWLPAPGTGFNEMERISQKMIDEGAHYPQMNGKTVFVHATKRMAETLLNSCKQAGVELSDIDLFLFHQANLRINSKVAEILGIPEEKIFNTIQKYGNTTAATIPLGMRDAIQAGALKRGMLVASAAFGSGFTWASSIYRY
ncbi:beta-ketoacyl-acyl-carrier-protein synthase III [Bacteriovorax sp. BSW11_IV]|uniref:3-oxoacyl-ACP synthase III family protein n=1 Tax=Bacteriovorax sp. BSW11_IV TaxID=1353529 RepID=UPI000389DC35|nr:beta-ketoacyl-ACP synthase III [Bacteriovorax sp. BSW11_IV]EQC45005.1 beta-ketoacyl-acyl-carrier-protein synthase III [Bacteriovorax sp. BSW11_IV]